MNDFHASLRTATHRAHERLHRQRLLSRVMERDLTMGEYTRILRTFFAFYAMHESRFHNVHPRYDREIYPLVLLRKDFAALGISVPSVPGQRIGTATPDLFSDYCGYLYMKQGSTLGGKMISKALEKSLGLERDKTMFFFNANHSNTGGLWRDFLSFAGRNTDDIDLERASVYARGAFTDLHFMMDEASMPESLCA